MPALLVQPSATIIGVNHQEFLNQAQMQLKPHLKLPFTFATADATSLLVIPVLANGAAGLQIESLFWEITVSMTGGASPAIGISSTNASYNTKGDLLGGASGDLTATLVSTGLKYKGGTLGAKFGSNGKVVLVTGDALRFDQIASAFTAGSGFVHINCSYLD